MSRINLIRQEGGSRIVSVTKVIPKDWIAVEIKVSKISKKRVTLIVEKVR